MIDQPGERDAAGLLLSVAWFETGMPRGPALGDPETVAWSDLVTIFEHREVRSEKDGPCFTPARFKPELDGRHVRRKGVNVIARTAIALDIEANKKTGEIPPTLDTAIRRAEALGLAALGYNSHSHRRGADRYRLVLPLDREVAPELPAVEIIAERLGLAGVVDMSKCNPASVFYLPSRPYDVDDHETISCLGAPVSAAWVETFGGRLLAARRAEQDRITAAAQAKKLAAGFDPDDSLIEKIRSKLPDLASVLLSHGYEVAGTKWRHPNSESGCFGADIAVLGGVGRIFSHNATDPLHASNLPEWCTVKAIDVFDVVTILEFGGDRTRAMRELAQRFGFDKSAAQRAVAIVIFRKFEERASQAETEAAAFTAGHLHGLTRAEVCEVAVWAVARAVARTAA